MKILPSPRRGYTAKYLERKVNEAYERAAAQVPTNWLDSILTGPMKVIGDGDLNCLDIENILLAVKGRILALKVVRVALVTR